jgi:GNAT superfamily N-acetyltransferase
MEGWGHEEIPETPKWQTQLGLNNSPFEYSVSFGLKTGKKQVQFRFELPAEENTPQAMQESAEKFNENLKDTDLDVLLWGFGIIRYIFFLPNPIGKFTAWYGYDDPIWKIYLDPQAQGQDNAGRLISQALHHLDMTKAWHVIDDTMQFGSGLPIRLGIDLVDEKVARVEVVVDYWGHPIKNFAHFATERYYPRNNEIVTEDEVVRLCKILLGVEDEDVAFVGEPPLVSYSFTRTANRDVELDTTLHIPVWPYMHDDAQFLKRVEEWMRGLSHVLSKQQIDNLVEGYRDCLKAVARRPLEDGSGLHSWFSLRDSKKHGDMVTVHFSTEMYGALPVREEVRASESEEVNSCVQKNYLETPNKISN